MGYRGYGDRRSDKGEALLEKWGLPLSRDTGHIKIKPVRCKKPKCKSCPHMFYAYQITRYGEKYLGTCHANGDPREPYNPWRKKAK